MIKFRCHHCSQKIGVPDNFAGKQVRCPTCHRSLEVTEDASDWLALIASVKDQWALSDDEQPVATKSR